MHPALRKGPLFLQNTPHFISCLRACWSQPRHTIDHGTHAALVRIVYPHASVNCFIDDTELTVTVTVTYFVASQDKSASILLGSQR